MANSSNSKKISKVIAIAMASAMAMSSLSAALVTASAVEDPALSTTGSVDFINSDARDAVAEAMGGKDGEVDTIVNNTFNLSALNNLVKEIEYTDNDGVKQLVDVDDISYRVSSGSAAKVQNDTTLTANKSGTSTLQIKVKGTVDLGGGKKEKDVTFTYNVTVNVHDEKELGLAAYNAKGEKLSTDDLNNLAAYNNGDLTFKLVSYNKNGEGKDKNFAAVINEQLKIGDSASTPLPTPGVTVDEVIAQLPDADQVATEALQKKGVLVQQSDGTFKIDLTGLTEKEKTGILVKAKNYTVDSAYAAVDQKVTTTPGTNQELATNTLYKEAGVAKAAGDTYFMLKDGTLPADIQDLLTPETNVQKNLYDKASGQLTDTSSANIVAVDVYKLKAKTDIENIVETPAITLGDTEAATKVIQEAINQASDENTPAAEPTPEEMRSYVLDEVKKKLTGNTLADDFDANLKAALTLAADKKNLEVTSANFDTLKVKNATKALSDEKSVPYTKTTAEAHLDTLTDSVWKATDGKYYSAADVQVIDAKDQKEKALYIAPNTKNTTVVTLADGSNIVATADDNYFAGAKKLNPISGKEGNIGGKDLAANKIVKIGEDYYTLTGTVPSTDGLDGIFELDTQDTAEKKIATADKTTYEIVADTAVHANLGELTISTSLDQIIKEYTAPTPAQTFADLFTITGEDKKIDLKKLAEGAYAALAQKDNQVVALSEPGLEDGTLTSVRFYAGTGAELFQQESDSASAGKWEKGTKAKGGYELNGGKDNTATPAAELALSTKGTTGSASVKAYAILKDADGSQIKEEYVLNLKVAKAVDFGDQTVTFEKKSGKTVTAATATNLDNNKSLAGYEIRTTGAVTVESGTLGTIKADGDVKVLDGKTGDIVEAATVTVEGATVGNIVDAKGNVDLSKGATAGKVNTDLEALAPTKVGDVIVTLNDATVTSIDNDGQVVVKGGAVSGDVLSANKITITSEDEDEDGDIMDTTIGGNVIAKGADAEIEIDNKSDEGVAELTIGGDVLVKYATTNEDDANLRIGSVDTSGLVKIGGGVQGEHILLGGNGLVTMDRVQATNEIEHGDEEAVVVDSTLEFEGFNSGINAVTGFANVTVKDGTVKVINPMTTTTLDVNGGSQLVVSKLTVEDILNDGEIVVPAGQLTVNGNVDDTPVLTLTGDVAVGTVAYTGDKGLADKFDLGGTTVKAEKQTNGTYNYVVSKMELYGLKAIGKNVTLGEGQTKEVSVVADAALPEGASIKWSSDDEEIATVTGNGTTATIKGVDVGNVEITATIVDSTGKDLGYDVATFTTDVLYANTNDVVGSEISVDTASKNMQVGETYNFLVRGNSDVDNIKLSYDANIVDVKLAQADYNGRGALYTITAKANGSTNIGVTYKGATANIAVKVGGFQLDTSAKSMGVGQTYSFLAKNVTPEQAANVKLTYDNTVAKVELANADYNGRGALFTVTALKAGSTDIKATYNNEEATMKLDVVELTGKMTLDTASYTMPAGGVYTIGVKIEKNGKELTGAEVNAMINNGELVVRDSRTGTIINKPEVLANGNVRVTGKSTPGTTYVMFEIVQNNQVVTHASVAVTVKPGANAAGISRRSVCQW